MFGREAARIDKEVQNTDFYLNKVEPISHVTQLTNMLRCIIDDEDQLEKITEIQSQFFMDINSDPEEIREHLKKQKEA